jgi:hypothetical protein
MTRPELVILAHAFAASVRGRYGVTAVVLLVDLAAPKSELVMATNTSITESQNMLAEALEIDILSEVDPATGELIT